MRTFKAKLEAATIGGPWIEIASGVFQPDAPIALDLRGEQYPGAVSDDFMAAIKDPAESGDWETTVGRTNYRVSWGN